jgi:carbon storage regulator CsrA
MLVRSRRVGESVRISPDITLTIVHVRGDQVRFRVTAPPDVGVYREEIVSELSQAAINALSARGNPLSVFPSAAESADKIDAGA